MKSAPLFCASVGLLAVAGAAIEVSVSHINNNDDSGENQDGQNDRDRDVLELGVLNQDGGDQIFGVRFRNLPVPVGSQIVSASLRMDILRAGDNFNEGEFSAEIAAEARANSPQFLNEAENLSARDQTGSKTTLVLSDQEVSEGGQVEIVLNPAMIQEVVNRRNWSLGNSMSFIFKSNGAAGPESGVQFRSRENGASMALTLEFDFEVGETTPPTDGGDTNEPTNPEPTDSGLEEDNFSVEIVASVLIVLVLGVALISFRRNRTGKAPTKPQSVASFVTNPNHKFGGGKMGPSPTQSSPPRSYVSEGEAVPVPEPLAPVRKSILFRSVDSLANFVGVIRPASQSSMSTLSSNGSVRSDDSMVVSFTRNVNTRPDPRQGRPTNGYSPKPRR